MLTVGIDEAGRGCWAGPLVAAAVILDQPIQGLNDSKLLTALRRQKLEILIKEQALAYGVGWVWPETIDAVGLTEATRLAMADAVGQLSVSYDEVIIDGTICYLPGARAVIKADQTVAVVSAASILAKVARDRFMKQLAARLPQYQFDKHVGYGTALHLEMLVKHGVSALHRHSYKPVQKLIAI